MTQPPEQHAQYAGSAIRMHPDNAPGEEGTALVLTRRRPDTRMAQEGGTPSRQTGERPQERPRRAAQPLPDELDNDALYVQRAPSSSRRYVPVAVSQGQTRVRVQHHSASAKRQVSQDFPFQAPQQMSSQQRQGAKPLDLRPRSNWARTIGVGMLVMFFGWLLLSNVSSWWTTTQNDWHYGRPRTYQTDAVVGHQDGAGDPSHFTVENFNRHVVVIEFEGGDPSKAISYVGPTLIGPGQDLTPVTVSFRDVNHDGKADMILTIEDNHVVFVNTGKAFRPETPADHIIL